MILVSDLLRRVGNLLNDRGHITWPIPELIDWANDGAAQIITRRPPAGSVTETLTLSEGALQSVNDPDVIAVLDIPYNITASGGPGQPIARTSRYQLDTWEPGWYEHPPGDKVVHYTIDDRDPTQFYVYPPVKEGVEVEALVARIPVTVADKSASIRMDRVYLSALASYVAHRALSKDDELGNTQAAALFYSQFAEALGSQNETTAVVSANRGEA